MSKYLMLGAGLLVVGMCVVLGYVLSALIPNAREFFQYDKYAGYAGVTFLLLVVAYQRFASK